MNKEKKVISLPPDLMKFIEDGREFGYSSVEYEDWEHSVRVSKVHWTSGRQPDRLADAILADVTEETIYVIDGKEFTISPR